MLENAMLPTPRQPWNRQVKESARANEVFASTWKVRSKPPSPAAARCQHSSRLRLGSLPPNLRRRENVDDIVSDIAAYTSSGAGIGSDGDLCDHTEVDADVETDL